MAMGIISLALLIFAAKYCFGSEDSKIFYIRPSSNATCSAKLCLTLSQLDGQLTHPISNATLILLSGIYSIYFNFSVANLSELSMSPNLSSELTIINCQERARFEFKNISRLFIKGLKFTGCGRNKIQMVHQFFLKESTFVGRKMSGTALEFTGATGFIVNNSFLSNKFGKLCDPVGKMSTSDHYKCRNGTGLNTEHLSGGGAINVNQSNLTITESTFEGNSAEIGGAIFATMNSNITIIYSAFKNNYATSVTDRSNWPYFGGVLHIEGGTPGSTFSGDGNCQLVVLESEFRSNVASRGGVLSTNGCTVNITSSVFANNSARLSGVIRAITGIFMIIHNCTFNKNYAQASHGAVYSFKISNFTVSSCYFANNAAGFKGGTLGVAESDVTIVNSRFFSNKAGSSGSAIYMDSLIVAKFWHEEVNEGRISTTPHVNIYNTYIWKNWGGSALYIQGTNLTISRSLLNGNVALSSRGGVLSIVQSSMVTITESQFFSNAAINGIILMNAANGLNIHRSTFTNNRASENGGVLKVLRASAHISQSDFVGNSASMKGGVLWSIKSHVLLKDTHMIGNAARYGGAIYAYDSKLLVYGGATHSTKLLYGTETSITDNVADDSGGGIYLYRSNIDCYFSTSLRIAGNVAHKKGGGIHAISSFIKVLSDKSSLIKSSAHFTNNTAGMGGGIYLQTASELHIQKFETSRIQTSATIKIINFTANTANYGGAIYSDDDTSGVCINSMNQDCFVQVTSVTSVSKDNLKYIIFNHNVAHKTGSDIFGGLLDRCNVNQYAEIRLSNGTSNVFHTEWIDGITYLKQISNMNIAKIASKPVRLCFCKSNNQPDCTYQPQPIHVRKGENFSVSLVAVDQVNHTIDSIEIFSSLNNKESGLGVGQMIQTTKNGCTSLNFNVYSPFKSEELTLYAEGPCKNTGMSQFNLTIAFLNCTCPIGFQQSFIEANNNCECECDSNLYPYITSCSYTTKTLIKSGRFWIAYLNDTDDSDDYNYLIYPYCPLDYCLTSTQSILINLNINNGADVQCANNRSGILCGVCLPGLSVSLGTSRCIPCSNIWPLYSFTIFMVALLLGIALVAMLLMLNITVAAGTLNGLIFFANIVRANSNSFFQHSTQFVYVLISWLNLEVGFDICLFKGMNTYWKTWLQLAFPAYVLLLVVMVILLSEHSTRFSRLIAKKNPVATLATLILLSYTKLLSAIIAALSFVTLDYPDGSRAKLWLSDASIGYLSRKHIPLFLTAVVVLIIGSAYTVVLFFWQWLLHHQNKLIFRWVKYQKLCHFIEPYHAPYVYQHRYWTGLLLLARIILYIVFALNLSSDPGVNLLATIAVTSSILVLKGYFGQVYKNWMIDIMELVSYFNLILFSTAVFFTLKSDTPPTVAVYISGITAFILVVVILAYHFFHEICLKVWKRVKQKRTNVDDNENAYHLLIESSKPKPTCTVIGSLSQMAETSE